MSDRIVCLSENATKSNTARAVAMDYRGKVHLTFIFKTDPANVAEGDRLFASHNAWMAKTHHREGDKALLTYTVSKGADPSNPLDPARHPREKPSTCLMRSTRAPPGSPTTGKPCRTGRISKRSSRGFRRAKAWRSIRGPWSIRSGKDCRAERPMSKTQCFGIVPAGPPPAVGGGLPRNNGR